jgi:uncharacterized membrane protein YbhN (UPF0104 family)
VRRPADLICACASLGSLALFILALHALPAGSGEVSSDVSRGLHTVPSWFAVGVTLVALLLSFAVALAAAISMFRTGVRRWVVGVAAAALAGGAALVSSVVWNDEHGNVDRFVMHGSNPSILVYGCCLLAFFVGGEVVRNGRWARWCFFSFAGLLVFAIASDSLAPLALPVVLLGGAGVGWLTRWALGATTTSPREHELQALLQAQGIATSTLAETAGTNGYRFTGLDDLGRPIQVTIADRRGIGPDPGRRMLSFLRLRPVVSGRLTLSSRARLERLALASVLSERAGAVVPSVLALSDVADETVVLVTRVPVGEPIADGESRENIQRLFEALAKLHSAGVAHRDLRRGSVVLVNGEAGFVTMDGAQPGASSLLRRLDVVQLLTTAARCSGADVALAAARDGYPCLDETALASVLQPIALAPWGWSEMRASRKCVEEMRRTLAGADAQLLQTSLVRFRWRTVVTMTAVIAALFVLVGELSKVDLAGALQHTSLSWCAVAVGAAAIGNMAAAENLRAFVPQKLSIWRGSAVQLASAFLGIAAPPTVGHMAVNARYLHRQGVDESAIAAAVALSQIVNILTTVLLVLVIGVLTGSGVSRFKLTPSRDLLVLIGAIAGVVALLLAVPATRRIIARNVWPRVRNIWPSIVEAVSNPLRLAAGGGANLLLTASFVVALLASIKAVGGDPPILATTVVFLAANAVGSAAPTPGGVGAVEAALTAGLTAIGIPVHVAIPAVLVFRLVTYWVPIPLGWVSYLLLSRRGIL